MVAQFWELIERGGYMPILAEIDRCEPFFIGLYGEKYGKPIRNYKFPRDPMWNKVRSSFPPGRSVLELETYWGALRDPRSWQPLFYFRDPAFLETHEFKTEENLFCAAETAPPLVSRYPERKTDFSIGATFKAENAESARRLLDLKRLILRTHGTDSVMMDYPCRYRGPVEQRAMVGDLEEFGDHVLDNLYPKLKALFPTATMAVDLLVWQSVCQAPIAWTRPCLCLYTCVVVEYLCSCLVTNASTIDRCVRCRQCACVSVAALRPWSHQDVFSLTRM